MTLSRRDFLRRSSLAIAGGLIVGDAALELLDRLSHRKVFALGAMPDVVDVKLLGASGGTVSVLLEDFEGRAIRRVRFNGIDADQIQDYGIGPNGRRVLRAWRHFSNGPVRVTDRRLLQCSVQPLHAQLEEGSWPTSPIVTYDKPVTRAPDILRFPWEVRNGAVQMTHPLPGSTPMRYDHKGRLLREAAATNYLTHSGDPQRGA